jgi:hypothetical protein
VSDRKRAIRKHLLVMVALILAIDAIAIALFSTLGIDEAPRNRKVLFTAAWTVATLIVVLNGLWRIRLERSRR